MSKMYDIIIIGGGPAGLTAAIYGGRANFSVLVIEMDILGGQITSTAQIDNYSGFSEGIGGMEMGEQLEKQARRFGAEVIFDTVEEVIFEGIEKVVRTVNATFRGRTLIIASGTKSRSLNIPGEEAFKGRGVSYCAICDGPVFKNKDIAVIGGGDAAVEEALFLTRFAKKVYIIHRRDQLRAVTTIAKRAMESPNIEILWNTIPLEIKGTNVLERLVVKNIETDKQKELAVSGVFIYVGRIPNSYFGGEKVIKLDKFGFIVAAEDTLTSVPGVFAAGDVRTKGLRQVITAAADGAIAATAAGCYLEEIVNVTDCN